MVDVFAIFQGMTPVQIAILGLFVVLTGAFSINFALARRALREFIDAVDDAATDGQYTPDEIAIIVTKGKVFLDALAPAIYAIITAIKAMIGGVKVPVFSPAKRIQGDSIGGDVAVAFEVIPKTMTAKVGEKVTVFDQNQNIDKVYFGDGSVWAWSAGDQPYVAYHTYKKAGTYEIQANAVQRGTNGAPDKTGFAVKTFKVTDGSEPSPNPNPTPVSIWQIIIEWILSFFK